MAQWIWRRTNPDGQRFELHHGLAARGTVPLFIFANYVHGRVVIGDVLHFPHRNRPIVVVLGYVVVARLREARVGRLRAARHRALI